MNKKQYERFERMQQHIKNLKRLFPRLRRLEDADALEILYRLEAKQSRAAVAYCNGDMQMEEYEVLTARMLLRLQDILGRGAPLVLNGDPRGYALKLDEEWCKGKKIATDWGSFGLLFPDF